MNAEAQNGVFGVSIVLSAWAMAAGLLWDNINFNHPILNRGVIAGMAITIFLLNSYILLIRKVGDVFNKEFDAFSRQKRIGLATSAIIIIVTSGIFLAFSVWEYRLTH